ncbi:MAG TPA: gamma-glutamyl-gamma-aminobutyrate hydrolase family protein [Acidobacteriota bacterium]|nr:gamma-glutamyl-gamma-aminobutyrate hydrolase family protein [Acidobacteriota bacterium]
MIDHKSLAPLIGLPARMDPGKDSQYLSRNYADAILASGGLPVMLPLVKTPEALQPFAETLDGVLLTGSNSDVDPGSYGEERKPGCGPVQPLRDKTDFMLLRTASERRIPVLAICFGLQSLNVFMGGSLIQDIPAHVKGSILHNEPRRNKRAVHPIEITPGSLLEELAGGSIVKVNSTHHQALARIGSGLEVIARAPDAVVEAVVGRDSSHWILGVQWHPEQSLACDGFSKRIFEKFIASCRSRRETHERLDPEDTQRTRRESRP